MESRNSSQLSQEPAIGPHSDADDSTPLPLILLFEGLFHYYPSDFAYIFQTVSLLQLFRAKSSMHLNPLTRMSGAQPSYPTRFKYPNHIGRRVQNIKLLITQYLPTALNFLLLMYELSPQHPVLCLPRSVFLLHCEKPIFTITQ